MKLSFRHFWAVNKTNVQYTLPFFPSINLKLGFILDAPYLEVKRIYSKQHTFDPQNKKMQKNVKGKRNEFISFFTDFYATIWARKVTQEEKIK